MEDHLPNSSGRSRQLVRRRDPENTIHNKPMVRRLAPVRMPDGSDEALKECPFAASDIRLRAKLISYVEMSLNHRAQVSGIPFVNMT